MFSSILHFLKKKPHVQDSRSQSKLPDRLEQSMTEVALDLIRGKGGKNYRREMVNLFKAAPTLVQDVDPQYRDALVQELRRTKTR